MYLAFKENNLNYSYLLRFSMDVDSVPLVIVKPNPRGSNLHVQLATAQVDVESDGTITQRQSQIILAITLTGWKTKFKKKNV